MGVVWARLKHSRGAPLQSKQAIEKLREVEQLYEKRLLYLQQQQQRKRQDALQLSRSGARVMALLRLREARRLEQVATKQVRHMDTVQELRLALEQMTLTLHTSEAIRDASRTLRVMNQQVERVDQLLQDASEQVQLSHDLVDRLAEAGEDMQPADMAGMTDEDLERELAALSEQPASAMLLLLPPPPVATTLRLPDAPRQEPIATPATTEEDDELAGLVRSMT